MKTHFQKSVSNLEWMIVLSVSISFISICSVFYLIDSSRKFDDISALLKPNLSYWMTVGDSFQVHRTITNIDEGSSLKVWVRSSGFTAGEKLDSQILNLSKDYSINFSGGTFLVTKKSTLTNSLGKKIGEFYLSGKIPFNEMCFILIFLILVSKILVHILLKEIMKFSESIISPLQMSLAETEHVDTNFSLANIDGKLNILTQALESQKKEIDSAKKLKKTSFVAQQIAHDLKSPLSVLGTAISLLTITDENLLKIINLSFERIDATILELEHIQDGEESLVSTKLNDVILEIYHEKKLEFISRDNLDLQIVINPSYGYSYVNPLVLKRILSNLINNAAEATSEGLKVVISLMSYGDSNYIVINDNGPGINESILNKIFEKGFTHGKSKGSGLGLYHAEQTLSSWKGKIKINSNINQGTSVIICLPLIDPEELQVEASS